MTMNNTPSSTRYLLWTTSAICLLIILLVLLAWIIGGAPKEKLIKNLPYVLYEISLLAAFYWFIVWAMALRQSENDEVQYEYVTTDIAADMVYQNLSESFREKKLLHKLTEMLSGTISFIFWRISRLVWTFFISSIVIRVCFELSLVREGNPSLAMLIICAMVITASLGAVNHERTTAIRALSFPHLLFTNTRNFCKGILALMLWLTIALIVALSKKEHKEIKKTISLALSFLAYSLALPVARFTCGSISTVLHFFPKLILSGFVAYTFLELPSVIGMIFFNVTLPHLPNHIVGYISLAYVGAIIYFHSKSPGLCNNIYKNFKARFINYAYRCASPCMTVIMLSLPIFVITLLLNTLWGFLFGRFLEKSLPNIYEYNGYGIIDNLSVLLILLILVSLMFFLVPFGYFQDLDQKRLPEKTI